MSEKTICPSCGKVLIVDENQKFMRCENCGAECKNPFYNEAIELVEIKNSDTQPNVKNMKCDDISEVPKESIKKKNEKLIIAITVFSSILLLYTITMFGMFIAMLFMGTIISIKTYIASIVDPCFSIICFAASVVLCKNRRSADEKNSGCLIAILVSNGYFVAECLIGGIISIAINHIYNSTWMGLIACAIFNIAPLILSAIALKNTIKMAPKYVAPQHLDGNSEFNAGLLSLIWLNFVNNLIVTFTLGLCTPWAIRRSYSWLYEHQVIDDRKLVFDGKAASLFGQWVKWLLLCIVTLGVYALFVPIKKAEWIAKNTHLEKNNGASDENKSAFDGKFWSYWGMKFLNALIVIFSCGICAPWAIVREQRWLAEHQTIDGKRLAFDGSAVGLFGQWIKWLLLSVVTIGIYAWWIPIKKQKWITQHTHFCIEFEEVPVDNENE